MKIAIVSERFDQPIGGGCQRSVTQMANELVSRGHQLTILTGTAGDTAVPGVEIRVRPGGRPRTGLFLVPFVRWFREQLNTDEFDASLSVSSWLPGDLMQPRAGILGEAHARLIARCGTRLGRCLKRVGLFGLRPQVVRWLERRQLMDPRVERVIAISSYMERQLDQHLGLRRPQVQTILNAAVAPRIDRAAARARMRRQLQLADSTIVYLFVATDPLRKGIVPLCRAMRRLRGVDAALVVVGPVPRHLRFQVSAGLRKVVCFLGVVDSVAELYCAADVTTLPTYYDPASKVVIESLMMGTPVITTAFNGAADFIDPVRPAGCVIDDPNDIDALVVALKRMADPKRRRRYREAALALRKELSMVRHVDQVEPLLRDVANRRRDMRRSST